jgi:hypothetical protein
MASETKRAINIPVMSATSEIAFLRALAGTNRAADIAWRYAPGDDGRADGRHLENWDKSVWQQLDAQLHGGCPRCRSAVSQHESAPIWPKAGPYIGVIRIDSAMFGLRPLCPERLP